MSETGAGAIDAGSPAAGQWGAPTPFRARPIFVLVGMHRTGASILAQMLQLLGVNMTENSADNWERSEITHFNDRVLELIDRPLTSATHALPFPAGWWASAEVRKLKREVCDYLQNTLEPHRDLWGFKDLRVTRLLPLWQQIFDELGLRPIYLWTVRDPADCAASATETGYAPSSEIAEAMWFVYNAEIEKYIGGDVAAVIDYSSWIQAPNDVVQDLLHRLPLRWRGSQADLLECVGSIAPHSNGRVPARIHSPLVRPFYDAIRDTAQSDGERRYRAPVTQALDILRALISPYTAMIKTHDGGNSVEKLNSRIAELTTENGLLAERLKSAVAPAEQPAGVASEIEHYRAEISVLRAQLRSLEDDSVLDARLAALAEETNAAVLRAEAAEALVHETESTLNREIEERISETSWLNHLYESQVQELETERERLTRHVEDAEGELARIRKELEAKDAELRGLQPKFAAAEAAQMQALKDLEQVQKELAIQKTANEKYLTRIYELKSKCQTLENEHQARTTKASRETGPAK